MYQDASCCCSGMAAAAPGLAICLLHLLLLNQGLLSSTASLAVPDQTSLSHFNPGNACSHLLAQSVLSKSQPLLFP